MPSKGPFIINDLGGRQIGRDAIKYTLQNQSIPYTFLCRVTSLTSYPTPNTSYPTQNPSKMLLQIVSFHGEFILVTAGNLGKGLCYRVEWSVENKLKPKGWHQKFSMFFQPKFFRIAQTPLPPSSILNEKTYRPCQVDVPPCFPII